MKLALLSSHWGMTEKVFKSPLTSHGCQWQCKSTPRVELEQLSIRVSWRGGGDSQMDASGMFLRLGVIVIHPWKLERLCCDFTERSLHDCPGRVG